MPFFIIFVLLALFWVLILVPQRRRQRAHAAMQDSVEVGDEIITAGGVHGEVVLDEGEILQIEIAPQVVVRLDRRAVAAVARELDELEPADEEEDEADEAEEPEQLTAGAGETSEAR